MHMNDEELAHDRTRPPSKMIYELMIYGRSTMKMVLRNLTSMIKESFGQEHGSRKAKTAALSIWAFIFREPGY
jgi:hypothetical protein